MNLPQEDTELTEGNQWQEAAITMPRSEGARGTARGYQVPEAPRGWEEKGESAPAEGLRTLQVAGKVAASQSQS